MPPSPRGLLSLTTCRKEAPVRKLARAVVLASAFVLSLTPFSRAFAWGNTGHEAVAYVAWNNMKPATQDKVWALLQLVPTNHHTMSDGTDEIIPGFAEWKQDALAAGATDGSDKMKLYIFMRAATWPDSIKHKFLKDSDDPSTDPDPASNIGFDDKYSHGYWHFIDQAFGTDSAQASAPEVPKSCWVGTKDKVSPTPLAKIPATPTPDAATQIVALRTALASTEGDDLKAYDLLWIEHLVGDIHQPLHAAVRYIGGIGDVGGNCIDISLPSALSANFKAGWSSDKTKGFATSKTFRAPEELHAFWDSLPGTASAVNTAFAETYASKLKTATVDLTDTDPASWANDSFTFAKSTAYKAPIVSGLGYPTHYAITTTYYNKAAKLAATRISMAGQRLAHLLDDALAN